MYVYRRADAVASVSGVTRFMYIYVCVRVCFCLYMSVCVYKCMYVYACMLNVYVCIVVDGSGGVLCVYAFMVIYV